MARMSCRPAGWLIGRRWTPVLAVCLALASCTLKSTGRSEGLSPSVSQQPAASPSSFPVTVVDDDGVSVTITSKPARIITFAPSNTEILFALGLGGEVVGVSGAFDNYPPEAKTIDRIGGSGEFGVDPNVEKVVALRPDLMLTIAGGDQWKQRLRDLGITVFTINATNVSDLLNDIRTVGRITGAADRAASVVDHMAAVQAGIQTQVSMEAPVACFFEAYYPPLTTIGPHTFIFDLLRLAGCDPVSANAKSDYPQWSVDQLVADSPAIYLVASESGVSPGAVAKRPGFSAIEAVAQGHVFLVDSDLISRPGPRVIDGLVSLAQILHPGSVP